MIRGSGIGEATVYSQEKIKDLIEICDKSSDVVGWYPHPYEKGNIRGPWNRWIEVSGDREDTPSTIASHFDEVYFIAAAMNHFPFILRELAQQKALLEEAVKVIEDSLHGYPYADNGKCARAFLEKVKNETLK